ncbi:hypothetical cytosolic protein [Syntrophus aciditrophicus SB]|uniref:Hypothetical cytosolic protein n=1 Tax=Syntrophus aciditrophicus (strain SB) TaxID=56780 RepID=Q2LWH8_SYNAS|nr:hypothetical cytosolic protein [Syntrophus aciditrophicus SB]
MVFTNDPATVTGIEGGSMQRVLISSIATGRSATGCMVYKETAMQRGKKGCHKSKVINTEKISAMNAELKTKHCKEGRCHDR